MAKVILLTSREIFDRFNLIDNTNVEKLSYDDSDAYKKVFEKKSDSTGIVSKIFGRRQGMNLYNQLSDEEKKNPDEVAKLVIPDHIGGKRGDFTAGVFRYPKNNPEDERPEIIYYFAKEYPYFEDSYNAKYEYMNALLEMIFLDIKKNVNVSIDSFEIFSHDRDWGEPDDNVSISKNVRMNIHTSLNSFFDEFNGKVMVFQHDKSFFKTTVVNMFPKSLIK
jgi:hypothetical protein